MIFDNGANMAWPQTPLGRGGVLKTLRQSRCSRLPITAATCGVLLSPAWNVTVGANLEFFDEKVKCNQATGASWVVIPVSMNVYSTARDGDVALTTTGQGVFAGE